MFLPGIVAQTAPIDPAAFERVSYHLQLLVVSVPQIALVIFIARRVDSRLPEQIGWRAPRGGDGAVAVIVLILTFALSAAVGTIGAGEAAGFSWSFSRPELAPLVILSGLVIGYREEIFYRAYLLTRLETLGAPRIAAIAISSLLFSVGHLYQGAAAAVFAALMGAGLAFAWQKTRSLHGLAIAHGAYNALVIIAGTA